jgi:hypothetical protein
MWPGRERFGSGDLMVDMTRPFVPESLSLSGRLVDLRPHEARLFNQIQGRSYLKLSSFLKQLIGLKMLDVYCDGGAHRRIDLETLVRFTDGDLNRMRMFDQIDHLVGLELPAGYECTFDSIGAAGIAKGSPTGRCWR